MAAPLVFAINGVDMTLRAMAEASPIRGMTKELILQRIRRDGMTPEQAMNTPLHTLSSRARQNKTSHWRRFGGGKQGAIHRMIIRRT